MANFSAISRTKLQKRMATTEYAEYTEKEEGSMTEGFLGNGQLFGNSRAKL